MVYLTSSLLLLGLPLAAALPTQQPFSSPTVAGLKDAGHRYLTGDVRSFIENLLAEWGSPGMSVAVVRRDGEMPGGWAMEAAGYGVAGADGRPMGADSLSAIASNSKLFTAFSVGMLLRNDTLGEAYKDRTGQTLSYRSKLKDLLPNGLWELYDPVATEQADLVDLLSHRTGLPRHDIAGKYRKGGVPEMISKLRYLRPSTGFRQGYQYNNMAYETLTELPHVLLNVTWDDYIQEHLFDALSMNSSTVSVAKAQKLPHGQLSEGFLRSGRNVQLGLEGNLTAIQPFFIPEGEEEIWRGAGGVLTSARDLTMWLAMLLGNGKHPFTNETIIPEEIVARCAMGVSMADGKPKWPELSIKGYGMGQEMYAYQGRQIIEHGGSNIGYKTQVSRFPNDNLGIAVLSNDEEFGTALFDIVKWHLAETILNLPLKVDWNGRSRKQVEDSRTKDLPTAYPAHPTPPTEPSPFGSSFEGRPFEHPTYGSLRFCPTEPPSATAFCAGLLEQDSIRPFLNASLDGRPGKGPKTLIAPFDGFFTQFIRLAHFDGNLFNLTEIFSNGKGAYSIETDGLAEWVADEPRGWAFRGGFWGKGADEVAPSLESLGLTGRDAAEVWFEEA